MLQCDIKVTVGYNTEHEIIAVSITNIEHIVFVMGYGQGIDELNHTSTWVPTL